MKLLDEKGCVSEALLSIISNTNDLMFVKTTDFVYAAASNAFVRNCVGCISVDDVIGKTDFELISDAKIAAYYRGTDEKLLASGKQMMEFDEVFVDGKGEKHPCMTAKYLLSDQNGKPTAIFGHYHGIDSRLKAELEKISDMNRKATEAMCRPFFVANYVDLTDGTYTNLWAMEYVRKIIEGCDTTEKGFSAFINALIKPEYKKAAWEFCDQKTLPDRLKGKKQIDFEYLSKVATGWCRISFYPAEWNEAGEVTHALFTVVPVDENQARVIEEGRSSQRDLENIFEEVPGGIVMYRWDGTELTILKMSRYYQERYGSSVEHQQGCPDFQRIHPDDIEEFKKAIDHALRETHSLEYVFRAWDQKRGRYEWTQINAVSEPQPDGTAFAYALYTDVTNRMLAKQDYEDRIRSLLSVQDGILTMCSINLTQDTYEMVFADPSMQGHVMPSESFEKTMLGIAPDIVEEHGREEYFRTFCRENMLHQAMLGNTHFQQEYLLRVANHHYEWVTACVDLVKNPLTDELGGVAYCKSSQRSHMEKDLLSNALKTDYLFSAVVMKDTDEFYIYNAEKDSFGERLTDFWKAAFSDRSPKCSQETIAYMQKFYNKEKMCRYLEVHPEFSYCFDGNYSGETRRLEAKFRYQDEERTTILVTLRDITDQRLQEQWRYDSEHDALTGLLNRKTVFQEGRDLLNQNPEQRYYMLHCDVKHFHLYNTFFGEDAGDLLLCKIAEIILEFSSDYPAYTCGRIESDVFCVIFPENTDVLESHVRQCVKELNEYSPDFPIRLAMGVYSITDPSMSMEAMFSRATIAAKSGEANLFGLISRYDDAMELALNETQQITSKMTAAIEKEQFEVYLQPKYELSTRKMVGAEVLVRWKDPDRGLIAPGKFIPTFEQNGFIVNLDRYMWEHMCRILHRWQAEGRPMYPVSVNVSRVSMYSRATVPFLKALVERYEIDPKYLELELTESACMDDPEGLKQMLRELQEYGFRILIDDFGSGYSSLNTLRELPVDLLKLDMKFLSETQNDPRANAVLSSVVRMSKLLHLPIVAEGIEKREQAEYLREIGCDYAQGFLFAHPMPAAEYEKLLEEADTSTEHTADAFGLIEDRSDLYHNEQFTKMLQEQMAASASDTEMNEVLKNIAMAVGSQYYAVYYIWLESRSYVCMQEKLPGILSLIGDKGQYEPAWEKYISGYIEKADQDEMRRFVEITSLPERLSGQDSLSRVYRRKEVGWTRGQFIPGRRDENGRLETVIYTVTDINQEVENNLKRMEAEQEAMSDPMTGLWNRKAFEKFCKTDDFAKRPVGLLLFDIDRFKGINDQYGHDVGDKVIKVVSAQVRSALRRNDLVFRMGGDEFAVLLFDCKEGIWNSNCRKLSQIHLEVREALPEYQNVTLSAGLCLNPNGYRKELYQLADKALYHTKVNGRGGCTMISLEGEILKEWHDASTVLRKGDVLEKNSTVTWRVEIPKKEGSSIRIYGDELFMEFIGAAQQMTPEECYQIWKSRLEPDYEDIVRAAVRAAAQEGSSEAVYRWRHPERGVLQLRASASLESDTDDYVSLIGYLHVTSGTHVFTLEDVSDRVRSAMEELYVSNYYIRMSDYSYKVYKTQPCMRRFLEKSTNAADVVSDYVKYAVAAESREKIARFLDLSTVQARLQHENIISEEYCDAILGRIRVRFVAVVRDESGKAETVSLIMEAM